MRPFDGPDTPQRFAEKDQMESRGDVLITGKPQPTDQRAPCRPITSSAAGASDVIPIDTRQLPRSGDYWLIPTRTATGNVVWPDANGVPRAMPLNGVDHHYAPLPKGTLNGAAPADLRLTFAPLAKPA